MRHGTHAAGTVVARTNNSLGVAGVAFNARVLPARALAGDLAIDAANFTPANCSGVITVAALNQSGTRASFSNYGTTVEISAPGENVLSTLNTGTTTPDADEGTARAFPVQCLQCGLGIVNASAGA